LLRGDNDWGNEAVMSEAERRGQPYLFKLRLRRGVKRVLERAMRETDWQNAGAGWQGKWARFGCLAGAGSAASCCCVDACARCC
jgi:hypothetical protein